MRGGKLSKKERLILLDFDKHRKSRLQLKALDYYRNNLILANRALASTSAPCHISMNGVFDVLIIKEDTKLLCEVLTKMINRLDKAMEQERKRIVDSNVKYLEIA